MASKRKNYVLIELQKHLAKNWKEFKEHKTNTDIRVTYYTRKQLIARLAINKYYTSGTKRNRYTQCITENILNISKNDLNDIERYISEIHFEYDFDGCGYKNKYIILKIKSDKHCIVNMDTIMIEVEEYLNEYLKDREKQIKRYEAEKRAESFEFRNGSVPNVHKRRYHRGSWYRMPQLNRTRRQSTIEEYQRYYRRGSCIRKCDFIYDDKCRHTDKSWKTSYKVRKQWDKHSDKHCNTMKILNKQKYLDDFIEYNDGTIVYSDGTIDYIGETA